MTVRNDLPSPPPTSLRKVAMTAFALLLCSGQALAGAAALVRVHYTWQRGDNLTGVLYRAGLGRQRGPLRLYGPNGWVSRNERHSGRSAAAWSLLPAGAVVELIVPQGYDRNFDKLRAVRPKVAVVTRTRHASSAPMAAASPPKAVEATATTIDAKPDTAVAPLPPVDDSFASFLDHIDFFAPGTDDEAWTLAATGSLGGLALLFTIRRRRRQLSVKLASSANAYLASLVMDGERLLSQSNLFEAMIALGSPNKAASAYSDLGFFAADAAWLERLRNKIDAGHANQLWQWRSDSEQHAQLVRLARQCPAILAKIIATATSKSLKKAVQDRLSQIDLNAPVAPAREDSSASFSVDSATEVPAFDFLPEAHVQSTPSPTLWTELPKERPEQPAVPDLTPLPPPAPQVAAIQLAPLASPLPIGRDQGVAMSAAPLPDPRPVIDLEAIEQIREIGADIFGEMLTLYLETLPERLVDVQKAVAAGSLDQVAFAAHYLKSSSAQFGAVIVADLCKDLEALKETGKIEDAAALAVQLDVALHDFAEVLRTLVPKIDQT